MIQGGCKSIENKNETPLFSDYTIRQEKPLLSDLEQITGIVKSGNKGKVWIHENTQNDPYIYLYDIPTGKQIKKVFVRGTSFSWEDLRSSNKDGVYSIHIADTGNANKSRNTLQVYTFDEDLVEDDFVAPYIKNYSFPDEPKDIRAMLVNSKSEEYYFFTYSMKNAEIFKISMHQQEGVLKKVGCFGLKNIKSADLSEDNSSIVFLTDLGVYVYPLSRGKLIEESLKNKKTVFEYPINNTLETKGVCYTNKKEIYLISNDKQATTPIVSIFENGKMNTELNN
ncbi:hypothetical protein NH26_21900 [Flammeovirga pacifica]|uniref:Uncharacterized protein n=1 Tax=Flammeovirga pacifica TaxID=915059 RepID=A0A1S1YTC0_FLAPC|nr:hypothetical protein NH26_21900 [Flammeovirga pacifica]